MANQFNAGQLATDIKRMCANDVQDLGNDAAQSSAIFSYMNHIMKAMPRIAELTTYSDALSISGNGYVTFLKNGVSIADTIFEPKVLYNSTDTYQPKRTSYDAPIGWIKESYDLPIHVRGLTAGLYTLKYLRYPATVTLATDPIDFPTTANETIIKAVIAWIKLSKNSYGGFQALDNSSKASMALAAQGAISAKSTGSTGQPLGPMDIASARGQ